MLRKILHYKYHARVRGHAEYSVVFATQALTKRSHAYLKFSDRELEDMENSRKMDVSGVLVSVLAVLASGTAILTTAWFIYFCLTTHA